MAVSGITISIGRTGCQKASGMGFGNVTDALMKLDKQLQGKKSRQEYFCTPPVKTERSSNSAVEKSNDRSQEADLVHRFYKAVKSLFAKNECGYEKDARNHNS